MARVERLVGWGGEGDGQSGEIGWLGRGGRWPEWRGWLAGEGREMARVEIGWLGRGGRWPQSGEGGCVDVHGGPHMRCAYTNKHKKGRQLQKGPKHKTTQRNTKRTQKDRQLQNEAKTQKHKQDDITSSSCVVHGV